MECFSDDHPHQLQQHSAFFDGPTIPSVNAFTPTKLMWISKTQAANYWTWKKQMHCLMESQGLIQFLDGTIAPPLPRKEDYHVWVRVDSLLKGWILSSLSEPIAASVVELKTASDVWKVLDDRFGQPQIKAPSLDGKCPMRVTDDTVLHRAALDGDWGKAMQIFLSNHKAMTNWIGGHKFTRPLHVAVGTGRHNYFVENLVSQLSNEELALTDFNGCTALHIAAIVGNRAAASVLVERLPQLCYNQNNDANFPIHTAALYAHRNVLELLIEKTEYPPKDPNPYTGLAGQKLLQYLIQSKFFDLAQDLTKEYPEMLRIITSTDPSTWPLKLLTIKKKALNTSHFTFFQRSVASYFHHGNYQGLLWKISKLLVPKIQELRDKMKADEKAQELLEHMCNEIGNQHFDMATKVFHHAILHAAELDVRDVIEAIIKTFPGAIYSTDKYSGQHIFHKAIENRSVDVFNLIFEMSGHKHFFTSYFEDSFGNNSFHSAGKLAPPHKLKEIRGAALQMQREMQWFKEVKKVVHHHSREQKNNGGKTPRMVFIEEHKVLKEEGEKWMRDTATSYSIVATLIATVVFAAAITVPGGNQNDTGFPIFSTELAFIIFAIFDAASLFSSTTSLLLCLSILTSRYSEEDFYQRLPKRLIFALSTLFISILFMLLSFAATMYLVFAQKRDWVLYPLLVLTVMPIASFVLLQTPLLYDLISTTYGCGVFGKQRHGFFY